MEFTVTIKAAFRTDLLRGPFGARVGRLAIAQALAGSNATILFSTASIIGVMLAPDPAWSTVPISLYVVGLAFGTLPTGWVSRRYGRRAAFVIGTACGVATGLAAWVAAMQASFGWLCLAAVLSGFYGSVQQTFRFAATDGLAEDLRPRAISLVMAGGLFGGIIGPQVVHFTAGIDIRHMFAATFLAQAALALLSMIVVIGVDVPMPTKADQAGGRPIREILRQPKFITAALCGLVSYASMNFVMTSAPLAMKMCGLTLDDSTYGIQWHVLGMFGPSFFTGSLIARHGAARIVFIGLVMIAATIVVGLAGTTVWHFWTGLVLLGIGWNFGFIGASAMVVECHRPEERTRVQAFNDFIIFGVMAFASFASGGLLSNYGWDAVNWVVLPPLALAFAGLFATGALRSRPSVALVAG